MRGHTHALFGLATLAAVEALTDFVPPHPLQGVPAGLALCAGAAILGALAPDLDAEEASIQHELGGLGSAVRGGLQFFGVKHRGLTHSGLATSLVMAISWLLGQRLGYPHLGLAWGLGYLSHILADAMTVGGVPLLWPLPGRVHLLPRPWRIRTGGAVEGLVFLVGGIGLAWLVLG